jgi:hypothetical protein
MHLGFVKWLGFSAFEGYSDGSKTISHHLASQIIKRRKDEDRSRKSLYPAETGLMAKAKLKIKNIPGCKIFQI